MSQQYVWIALMFIILVGAVLAAMFGPGLGH